MANQKDKALCCNGCGRSLVRENGIYREDYVRIHKKWGYFSSKDTENHTFILCEDCYDRMVKGLAVPPEITEETELLSIG
ncbi:MAG: hypothetical protein HFI38_02915 [Lachnospiraceae bacterium]|jgi:hypothetical protein|nr:hypothetical protein [Lachnospiraceae bacterium]